MRRGVVVLAAGALALFGAERARAQVAVYFQPTADTATGAVPGVPTPIEIRLRDSASATVQGATLTFYYDSTRMQILGVLPEAGVGLDSIADTTRGPGSFAEPHYDAVDGRLPGARRHGGGRGPGSGAASAALRPGGAPLPVGGAA